MQTICPLFPCNWFVVYDLSHFCIFIQPGQFQILTAQRTSYSFKLIQAYFALFLVFIEWFETLFSTTLKALNDTLSVWFEIVFSTSL